MKFGYACIFIAVAIWGGWMAATRFAVNEAIAPLDLAFLRYGVPAVMLAPYWVPRGIVPKDVPRWTLIAMMGWGAPFVILMAMAMETASVAHVAAIVPCMMPLIAAALGLTFFGERFGSPQKVGFCLIGAGAACVMVPLLIGGNGKALYGIGLLMLCALGWASFTTAYRRSGLNAAEAAGLICLYSTVLVGIALLVTGSSLSGLNWQTITFHAIAQGFLSGAVATIAYGIAIERLGSPRASSFSALVPGIAAVIAYVWLLETPTTLDVIALILASLGVAFVNNAFSRRRAA